MYILFLLFGILLYFLINKYDAFFVGVPYIKVYYSTRDNQYYLINMDDYEPEPQDVGEPLFNGYVDQDTYQTMERNIELDNTRDPSFESSDCIPESIPGTTCEQLTDDTILLEIFKTQLVSNGIFLNPESATDEAKTMVEFTKLTYKFLIDNGVMTQEQAIEHMSKRPDILRRFNNSSPELWLWMTGRLRERLRESTSPRLPTECAVHVASFLNSESLYEWLLRNIESVDFNILTQYFDPNDYINFVTEILIYYRTYIDIFQTQLENTANMLIDMNSLGFDRVSNICVVFNLGIIPIIIESNLSIHEDMDIVINLFHQFNNVRRDVYMWRPPIISDGLFNEPNIYKFLWLLVNIHLSDLDRFNRQFIIDTYINDDTYGLLEHLLQDESIRTQFGNIERLRQYLINQYGNYKNLLSMISIIVDYLYAHFNAGR